jgi:hypothetical protein
MPAQRVATADIERRADSRVEGVEPTRVEAAPEPSRVEPSRVEPARVEPARVEPARVEPSRVEPSREPTRAKSGVDLAREVEIVDAAMAALRNGDATAALASVRLHRAETNNQGQLAEDAAAIEVEALCRLHDRRVVAKLEAFDARWPESAQRSRLTNHCP